MIWPLVAIAIASFALSYAAAKKAQRDAKKAADAFKGVLVNKESNIDPIPVVYGERRVGGTRVFVQAEGGKKNEFLYIAMVLCEGEVDDIYDIKIDDYSLTDSRWKSVIETRNDSPYYKTYRGGGKGDLIQIEAFYGNDSQPASPILRGSSKWSVNHRLQGVAYLAIRLKWDENLFSGIPDITAVVRGKKIKDVRTNVVAWSDNPANVIYDYLTNKRYGKGLSDGVIDVRAFRDAADFCDASMETVETTNFTREKIFRCNMVVDTGDRLFENVQKMLLGCRGFLPYSNGKYALKIDQRSSPVMTLTINEIIGGISISGESKKDRFNRVNVKFVNPNNEWQPDEASWPDAESALEAQFLEEDGGEILVDEVDMEMITSYYAARDFARIFCLRSRNALRCQLTATSEALNLVPGDVVRINHPTPGWTSTLKDFQVEELTLNFDGTVDLVLVEYDPSIYAYQAGPYQPPIPDTDLPDPFDIDPPTNLVFEETTDIAADGTLLVSVKATWEASPNSFVTGYEIGWFKSNTSVVFTDTLGYTGTTTPNTTYLIQNLEEQKYVIGVRAISTLGARSDWLYGIFDPQGDTTAPGAPKDLVATAGLNQINLSWVNDTARDIAYTEIMAKVFGTTDPYVRIGTVGRDTSSFVHTGLEYGIRWFYLVRHYDYSGNRSANSNLADATTLFVDSGAFSEEVSNLFDQAGLYGIQPYPTLEDANANTQFTDAEIGKLIYVQVTYDAEGNALPGKLYEWTAQGFQQVVPDLSEGIGQIKETNISDDAISVPKLEANFIESLVGRFGQIEAKNIKVDQIAAGLAQFAGVIANSAMFEKAVIDNAAIRNLAVTTFKIGDNAVTIPEFDKVTNSNSSYSNYIPHRNARPIPYNDLHPANYITTEVVEFDWGADADQQEINANGYNASIPPARIAAFADTVFQALDGDARNTCTTRIIAVEGTSQQVREVIVNGTVRWDWTIQNYRKATSLPSSPTGLGNYSGYYVNRQAYIWNGVRFVRNTSFQAGEFIHVVTTNVLGTPTSSYFAKWWNAANRFIDGNGILDVGLASTTAEKGSTGQVICTGYWDTSRGFIVSNKLKFAVMQQIDVQGDSRSRQAVQTSLLLLGTKK